MLHIAYATYGYLDLYLLSMDQFLCNSDLWSIGLQYNIIGLCNH